MVFIYQIRKQGLREVTKLRTSSKCTQLVSGKAERHIQSFRVRFSIALYYVVHLCNRMVFFFNGILAARRRPKQVLKTLLEMEVQTSVLCNRKAGISLIGVPLNIVCSKMQPRCFLSSLVILM